MTYINPYLNFNGNCCDALTFYHECLGGELNMQTVGESPMAGQMPAHAQNTILHASLTYNGLIILMGSDMLGVSLTPGNSVSLSLNCSTEDEIYRFFNKLAAEGQVRDQLADMFWGAKFGTLTDKFGINWILNYAQNQ